MQAKFARGLLQAPVVVLLKQFSTRHVVQATPSIGDLVTVHSADGGTAFSIRLTSASGADEWCGVIFGICRGTEVLDFAEGLEVDDVVVIRREEIASVDRVRQQH